MILDDLKRKKFGAFETPIEIFKEYIFPVIKHDLHNYIWVDLYCGSGNLILPILEAIPKESRLDFFSKHIFLFDILPEMVEKAINNAERLGIPRSIAEKNIQVRDVFKDYPEEILNREFPVFHITNPPYMYIGYIKKNKEFHFWLKYFNDKNKGYQDLYQIALINDLRHNIQKMIYIIPTNFLFGSSISNKIRKDLLLWYNIKKVIIFERKIFEFTGQHVGIFFFERKKFPMHLPQTFEIIKINRSLIKKTITIKPSRLYRGGDEFSEFVERFRANIPIQVDFYLFIDEIERNPGKNPIIAIDANRYTESGYEKRKFYVNDRLLEKIKNNILFVKTIDGTKETDKAGIYEIKRFFEADCIIVSRSPYRTHPIQLFFNPTLSIEDQLMLKEYFNLMLNYFRDKTDSEFMTTYKYSNTSFTRKYLGLNQVKKLIQTFPIFELDDEKKKKFIELIRSRDIDGIITLLKKTKNSIASQHDSKR